MSRFLEVMVVPNKHFFTMIMLVGFIGVFLQGCSSQQVGSRETFDLMVRGVELQGSSYEAAEYLSKQAVNKINPHTPIAVGTLSDVNAMETSSALGRLIAEQIASRLVHLGHTVAEVRLRNAINVKAGRDSGEYMTSRDPSFLAPTTNVGAIVTGTYTVGSEHVHINLRLIDVNSGRIVSAYDYQLENEDNVRELVQTDSGSYDIFSKGH